MTRSGGRPRAGSLALAFVLVSTQFVHAAAQQTCPAPPTPIAPGPLVAAALETTDCFSTLRPNSYADRYSFQAVAGTRYRVAMSAPTYDAYLYLLDAAGNVVTDDDDSGPVNDAGFIFVAPSTGTYLLEATSLGTRPTGPYTIGIATDTSCASTAAAIAPGQTVADSLTFTDCYSAARPQSYADTFTFQAAAGEQYKIEMYNTGTSEAVDSYLYLRDPSGAIVAQDDDSGMFIDARIVYDAPVAGTYTVEATSKGGGEIGPYELTLASGACTSSTTPIAYGQTLSGTLSETDCYGPTLTYAYVDRFVFDVTIGDQFSVGMQSDAFNSWIVLRDPSGTIVAQADHGGEYPDAAFGYLAVTSGTYTLEATSYGFESTGPYTVSLSLYEPPPHECTLVTTPIAPGSGVQGTLAEEDCYGTLLSGSYTDRYTFQATAGVQYAVDAVSVAVNPWVGVIGPSGATVVTDDNGGDGWNARAVFTAPANGTYTIEVSTPFTWQTGAYVVTLWTGGSQCTSSSTAIAPGNTVAGSLTLTDCLGSVRTSSYHDRFTFAATAGQEYVITMTSTDMDSYLVLLDPNLLGTWENDDGGGGLDAQIRYTPHVSGPITIEATTWAPFSTGTYSFSLVATAPCTASVTPIAPGQQLAGALAETDCRSEIAPASFADTYTLAATAGTRYEITMRSAAIDARLFVSRPGGAFLASDDDSGGGTDAKVVFLAGETGTYRVEAVSSGDDETGAYTIEAAVVPSGPCTSTLAPIAVGVPAAGALAETDCVSQVRADSYQDRFTFTAAVGTRYAVSLQSGDFDTWLSLLGPDGDLIASNDDSGGTSNSRVVFVAETAGTHTIEVSSWGDFQTGAYTAHLLVDDGECTVPPVPIEPGDLLAGALTEDDCYGTVRTFAFADAYTFAGVEGTQYVVDLISFEFDAWLVVKGPSGEIVAEDDDGGIETDAHLVFTAAASGTYTIEATSYGAGETGEYEIDFVSGEDDGGGEPGGEKSTGAKTSIGVVTTSGAWFLRDANSAGGATEVFSYGAGGAAVPLAGDWDGDGDDSPGIYDPQNGVFFLKNKNLPGGADLVFAFGPTASSLVPVVGDWDGDGRDTVGLYDPQSGAFFLTNKARNGPADLVFTFGPGGGAFRPIAGDWNGDGIDTIGIYGAGSAAFFLRNSNAGGGADLVFTFGPANATWRPLAGDWSGSGADGIGLYSPETGTFFLKRSPSGGAADYAFQYGASGLAPLAGDWDGV